MRPHPVEINGSVILAAVTIPMIIAVLAAVPFWRRSIGTYGAVVGAALLALAALAFFLWDGVTITRALNACNAAGVLCPVKPTAFVRFAVFAFIAMGQTMTLFVIDLRLEQRRQQREFATEWRR